MSGQQSGHPGQAGQVQQVQQGRTVTGYPVKEGAIFGLAAYIAGYVLTYLLLAISDLIPDENVFQGVGQIFYSAQFVRLDFGADVTFNALHPLGRGQDPLIIPPLFMTALIAGLLVGAGYLVVRTLSTPGMNTNDGMVAGSAAFIGYLPPAFLGAFIFESEFQSAAATLQNSSSTIAPDIFAAVLIAGLLFPIVLGAIGGYLGVRYEF